MFELGKASAETKGNSPGPVAEPMIGSKFMRWVIAYL
jgi:hypothetical protein